MTNTSKEFYPAPTLRQFLYAESGQLPGPIALYSSHDGNPEGSGETQSPHPDSVALKRFDGLAMTTKADFFTEFSRVLEFPHHFGRNWDAFADCLGDLGWLVNIDTLILVFEHPEKVLSEAAEGDFGIWKSIYAEVTDRHDEGPVVRFLLITTEDHRIDQSQALVQSWALSPNIQPYWLSLQGETESKE